MTTKMLAKNKSLIKKDGEPKPKKKGNNQYGLYSSIITDGKRQTLASNRAGTPRNRKSTLTRNYIHRSQRRY